MYRYTTKGTETGGYMTNLDKHPTVRLEKWTGALDAIKTAINSSPESETITFHLSQDVPSSQVHKKLIAALRSEKVVASQPLALDYSEEDINQLDLTARLGTSITGEVSTFKAGPLRDYLGEIEAELNDEVTPHDLSVFLNRMGYSSVSVPVSKYDLATRSQDHLLNEPSREWDAYIAHVTNDWKAFEQDPLIFFHKEIAHSGSTKVLIDATTLEPRLNGTSRNAIGFLQALISALSAETLNWEVTLAVSEKSKEVLRLETTGMRTVSSLDDLHESFDLGFNLTPVSELSHCLKINHLAARWIVLHLDIIAIRSLPFLSQNTDAKRAVDLYLSNADKVVFISEAGRNDACEYFGLTPSQANSFDVVLEGNPISVETQVKEHKSESYVLVLGNDYPHKQVDLVVKALCDVGMETISIGSGAPISPLHQNMSPGSLSDSELLELMKSAAAVVFPSMYEGYGLPIAEAAALGIPVVLWDTAVAREVSKSLGTTEYNRFCSSVDELLLNVKDLANSRVSFTSHVRSLAQFNNDLIDLISNELQEPVNTSRLKSRWKLFSLLEATISSTQANVLQEISTLHWRNRLQKALKLKVR